MKLLTLNEGGPDYYSDGGTQGTGYWRSHERFVKRGTVRVIDGKLSQCFLVDNASILHGIVFPSRCLWCPAPV